MGDRGELEGRISIGWDEFVKKNPLMEKGLGELFREMIALCLYDPNVLKPVNEIPEQSRENYQTYLAIVNEINRRENKFSRQRSP